MAFSHQTPEQTRLSTAGGGGGRDRDVSKNRPDSYQSAKAAENLHYITDENATSVRTSACFLSKDARKIVTCSREVKRAIPHVWLPPLHYRYLKEFCTRYRAPSLSSWVGSDAHVATSM